MQTGAGVSATDAGPAHRLLDWEIAMPEGEGEPSLAAADTLTSPRAGRLIRLDDFAYVRRIRRWEPHACDCPAPAPPAGSPLILSRPSMKQCRTPLEKREVPGAANSGTPSLDNTISACASKHSRRSIDDSR
jgi:hypothetical protein